MTEQEHTALKNETKLRDILYLFDTLKPADEIPGAEKDEVRAKLVEWRERCGRGVEVEE